jgi:hypothetical protein
MIENATGLATDPTTEDVISASLNFRFTAFHCYLRDIVPKNGANSAVNYETKTVDTKVTAAENAKTASALTGEFEIQDPNLKLGIFADRDASVPLSAEALVYKNHYAVTYFGEDENNVDEIVSVYSLAAPQDPNIFDPANLPEFMAEHFNFADMYSFEKGGSMTVTENYGNSFDFSFLKGQICNRQKTGANAVELVKTFDKPFTNNEYALDIKYTQQNGGDISFVLLDGDNNPTASVHHARDGTITGNGTVWANAPNQNVTLRLIANVNLNKINGVIKTGSAEPILTAGLTSVIKDIAKIKIIYGSEGTDGGGFDVSYIRFDGYNNTAPNALPLGADPFDYSASGAFDDTAAKLALCSPSDFTAIPVIQSFTLPSQINGMSVTWKSLSPNIISDSGKVRRPDGADAAATLLASVTNAGVTLVKAFDFTVKVRTDDVPLSTQGTVTGTVAAASGSKIEYVNDWNEKTVYITSGYEKTAAFTFDLESEYPIAGVKILEIGDVIETVGIDVSNNKTNWIRIYDGGEKEIRPALTKNRYVRVTVLRKKPDEPLNIAEIIITDGPTPLQRVETDRQQLQLPSDVYLTQSFSVPKNGEWGTVFTPRCDSGFIAVAGGTPNYILSVISTPEYDTPVTITIDMQYESVTQREYKQYTVKGKYTNQTVNVSAGRGGGAGSGGGTAAPPFSRQNTESSWENTDESEFKDLDSVPWARAYIIDLKKRGVISGNENGEFEPGNSVTREQYTKMLALSLNLEPVYGAVLPFEDVSEQDWFYPYVSAAYINGIVTGISGSRFGTGLLIIRQDIAVMTARGIKNLGILLTPDEKYEEFTDAGDISEYAVESVSAMRMYGVISGDQNRRFNPRANATRAEAAKILSVVIGNAHNLEAGPAGPYGGVVNE